MYINEAEFSALTSRHSERADHGSASRRRPRSASHVAPDAGVLLVLELADLEAGVPHLEGVGVDLSLISDLEEE